MNIQQIANARWDELPLENFVSFFSEAGKPTPDTPSPSLEDIRGLRGTVAISTVGIFSIAIPKSLHNLANIALVCSTWNELQKLNSVWKPVLDRFKDECKFAIDLPKDSNNKCKIQLFINKMFDLKSAVLESYGAVPGNGGNRSFYMALQHSQALQFNNFFKYNVTNIFNGLIDNANFEIFARHILFKPVINVNQIAVKLFPQMSDKNEIGFKKKFCFELLIKMKYDLSAFFNINLAKIAESNIFNSLFSLSGLKITDYIESGCNLSLTESPNFSLLQKILPVLKAFYARGQFQVPLSNTHTFQDVALNQHLRKAPLSEKDLKKFFFDLLTKAGLKLDFYCSEKGMILECPALVQLRDLAVVLPQGNALAQALGEYDYKNSIPTNSWERLSGKEIVPMFSLVGKSTPKPSLEPAPERVSYGITITTYSKDYLDGTFSIGMPQCLKNLANISLVCKRWKVLQQMNGVWEPVLDRLNEKFAFHTHFFPENASTKYKVYLFINSLFELKSTMLQSFGTIPAGRNFYYALAMSSPFQVNTFLEYDVTNAFIELIDKGNLKHLAKHIFFKPKFDVNKIAYKLFSCESFNDAMKCFELIVKLNYDVSEFFRKNLSQLRAIADTLPEGNEISKVLFKYSY